MSSTSTTMRARRVAGRMLAILLAATSAAAAADGNVIGRVRVTLPREAAGDRLLAVTKALEGSLAEGTAGVPGSRRLVSLRPRDGDPDRFDATVYDHSVERAFELVVDGRGAELSRRTLADEPPLAQGELADATAIVTNRSPWSAGLARGTHRLYAPMPPVTTDPDGRRLVNVGVQRPTGGLEISEHEIVSVHVPTGEIVRWPSAAPPTGLATTLVCGPPEQPCGAAVGGCGAPWRVEWPAASPVWAFDVWHPKCTQSVQPSGTGVEIRDVRHRGRLILARGHVPVVNVRYEGNVCGPYRDWLFSENCFQASGSSPAPGIIVSDGVPASTFCDSGSDAGNFKGVAIVDEGSALVVTSEMDSGHYRYVMRWRFGLDGSIEPSFGFGATSDSCTCHAHYHHVYWRLEPALDGATADLASGINTLERRVVGPVPQWSPIPQEGLFVRPAASWEDDEWRIRNPQTGLEYVLTPGHEDGSAAGDDYARGDLWALAYQAGQIDDANTSTAIRIDGWVNQEALGASKRLVLWYRAGFSHEWSPSGTEPCHLVGPTLRPARRCPADVALERESVGCAGSLDVAIDDPDEAGAGSATVVARSGTEPAGEAFVLAETAAGTGRFAGTIEISPEGTAAGDGRLAVAHGEAVTVAYADLSSCGASGVVVERTATADCSPPAIAGVAPFGIGEGSATISWTTDEPATSRVSYGAPVPQGTVAEDPANLVTAHALLLEGLAPCTTYGYAVASTDAAGNTAVDPPLGGLRTFTTAGVARALGPDDVESGPGAWQASGPAGAIWHVDSCRAASPTRSWKAGATSCPGSYAASADTYLVSPPFSLGPAGHGYVLRFKEFYATQAGADLCRVQLSTDGGDQWTTVAQYSGASGGWLVREIDLAPYASPEARIRFWFHSDGATSGEGWYVDDIEVRRVAPCSPSLRSEAIQLLDVCDAGGTPNGFLEPGERASVRIAARNVGLAAATEVGVRLVAITPGVTILGAEASLPDLPAGGAGESAPPHPSVALAAGAPCGGTAAFELRFVSAQGEWSEAWSLAIGRPGDAVVSTRGASDVPRAIPDFPAPPSSSTIVVSDPGTIVDLDVGVSIVHPYVADLDLVLIAPDGRHVELSTDNGGAGDDYDGTRFDDEASVSIAAGTAPFRSSFRPEGALGALDGMPAAGAWTLEVTDDGTLDVGSLVGWFLRPTIVAPACASCPGAIPSAEVTGLVWEGSERTTMSWDPVPGAAWYEVREGSSGRIAGLLDAGPDSCPRAIVTAASVDRVRGVPEAGSFLWYLVRASGPAGAGPAGAGSAGPRVVDDASPCP